MQERCPAWQEQLLQASWCWLLGAQLCPWESVHSQWLMGTQLPSCSRDPVGGSVADTTSPTIHNHSCLPIGPSKCVQKP